LNPRKNKIKIKIKIRTGLQSVVKAWTLALGKVELVTNGEAIVELGRATNNEATLNVAGRSKVLKCQNVEWREVEAWRG
jgi:hypothetical protein